MASAFEIYLRTGRRVSEAEAALETKFNPWHDAENGRFTFANQGRFFPGVTARIWRTQVDPLGVTVAVSAVAGLVVRGKPSRDQRLRQLIPLLPENPSRFRRLR